MNVVQDNSIGADEGSGVSNGSECSHDADDDVVREDALAHAVMVSDSLPVVGRDEPDGQGCVGDSSLEQQLSAAGPAPAASDVSTHFMITDGNWGRVANPAGMNWVVTAFNPWQDSRRLDTLFKRWRGQDVEGDDEDGAPRATLDAWQGFACDIVAHHESERVRLLGAGRLGQYKPLRMLLVGTAGCGKSSTVRSIVRSRRASAVARGESLQMARGSCVLGAPTGCASF